MKTRSIQGFSLLEVLVAVATLGVIATIAYGAVGRVAEVARTEKLRSDVFALNRAVNVYMAGGGSLEGVETAEEVLRKLRTTAQGAVADRMPTLSSSLIDPRITLGMQTGEDAEEDGLRAYWDSGAGRFTLAETGAKGIKEFYLDEAGADADTDAEDRSATMLYASDDGWVWDYEELPIPKRKVPTVVRTSSGLKGVIGGGGSGVAAGVAPEAGLLLEDPEFSLPGGKYAASEFDLLVDLRNPNPAGSSELYYAVDGGAETKYTGSILVAANSALEAKVVAVDPNFEDSAKILHVYALAGSPDEPEGGELAGLIGPEISEVLAESDAVSDGLEDAVVDNRKTKSHDNGHGNNEDGADSSNPGQGGGPGSEDASGDVDDETIVRKKNWEE